MSQRAETEYRYEKLTWPEINDAHALGATPGRLIERVISLSATRVEFQHSTIRHKSIAFGLFVEN